MHKYIYDAWIAYSYQNVANPKEIRDNPAGMEKAATECADMIAPGVEFAMKQGLPLFDAIEESWYIYWLGRPRLPKAATEPAHCMVGRPTMLEKEARRSDAHAAAVGLTPIIAKFMEE